jgi:hypothetical protein
MDEPSRQYINLRKTTTKIPEVTEDVRFQRSCFDPRQNERN